MGELILRVHELHSDSTPPPPPPGVKSDDRAEDSWLCSALVSSLVVRARFPGIDALPGPGGVRVQRAGHRHINHNHNSRAAKIY